jgi:hypothetical protein
MHIRWTTTCLLVLLTVSFSAAATAQKNQTAIPDFTRGDKIPPSHNHDWTLGPTGAVGWIYSNRLETTQARQILVTKVEPSSPSDGILDKGDVIIGVAGEQFQFDPRVELGRAVTAAEASSGKLELSIWRNEKTKDVTVPLDRLGRYSKLAPHRCDKSQAIFERGCNELAKRMASKPDRNGIVRAYNTLALLAGERQEFIPLIKQQIDWAAKYSDVQGQSLCCWYYDLARRWDGTFRHQGPAQARHDSYRNWDATGAYLLAYAQSSRTLYITGKQTRVATVIDATLAERLIDAGRGYSHREKNKIYADKSIDELLDALASWSPVVRERAATAFSKRKANMLPRLQNLYTTKRPPHPKHDFSARNLELGFCQAAAQLGPRAESLMPELMELLDSNDLWVRVKAAEALSAIGKPARPAIPKLLTMLRRANIESDPRFMEQRFLSFALFNRRGLLSGSLDGVDRDQLFQAVRAGLKNEDGRARAAFSSVYRNLSFNEIKPLLPAIYRAVAESAPSGMMFADGIRLSGLEILAKHKIKEGLPLCIELIEPDRWGSGNRVPKCLKSLQAYGSAAKPLLPKLKPLQAKLESKKRKNEKDKQQLKLLNETLRIIKSSNDVPELRSLQPAA